MALASLHLCTYALTHTNTWTYTHFNALTTRTHINNRPHFPWNTLLASSLVAVVRIAERLSRVGIAFWFPQSLLSGSQQDSSLIVTTGAVLQIRGAHRRWQGLMLWAGVGEWMRDIARVQNKGGSGSEGVGEVVLDWRWTYGWNWSSRKVSSRDQGGEIANLDRGIKAVKSGSGGRDFEIGIRAGRWQTEQENRTKPSLFCLHTALVQYLEDCIRRHGS